MGKLRKLWKEHRKTSVTLILVGFGMPLGVAMGVGEAVDEHTAAPVVIEHRV